ncbi:MAG TPA: class I SAM-dependent methyltransferase [Armatimonadota bacterium]|jgi:2-polyprenyl-3-methyl-5-hydroxy-6-metoxy-1,4-benzoquinol methylase
MTTTSPDELTARQIYEDNLRYFEGCARLYDLSNPAEWNLFERSMLRHDLALMGRLMEGREPVRVLDVGAGTGRVALPLARRGWQVLALDLSEAMLQMAQGKARRAGLHDRLQGLCVEAAGFLRNCPTQFDVIVFSSVLHHLPQYVQDAGRACELLAPGGVMYITHEPQLRTAPVDTLGMKVVLEVDRALRLGQQIRKHIPRLLHHWPKPPTYPNTDYHFELGCDREAIEAELGRQGLQVLHRRLYKPRNTALMAWLDSTLFRTPNWHFRLVAQKGQEEG